MAFNSLIQTGANKKTRKDKAVIDEISATLILQSYLISNLNQFYDITDHSLWIQCSKS